MKVVEMSGGGRKPHKVTLDVLRWNGERVGQAIFVNYKVTVDENTPPNAWYRPFEGEIRQGVKVIPKKGESFFLDNEDGTAYIKMRQGGLFSQGHKTANGEIIEHIPIEQVNRELKFDKYKEVFERNKDQVDDEQWARIEELLKAAHARVEIKNDIKGKTPKIKRRDVKRHLYHENRKKPK